MLFFKKHLEWLKRHAYLNGENWICHETNSSILYEVFDHPIKNSKGIRMVSVAHMYCPGCEANWNKSNVHKIVTLEELVEGVLRK